MSNQQLIKLVYIFFVAVILAFGVWSIAGAGMPITDQNSNQNSNRSANENRTQNRNANRNSNAETKTPTGEPVAAGTMSSQDRDFLMDAAMGGMMEVQLGRWAKQKATSDAVKQFAQRMIDDHSKANADLMTLATSKGITLPTALDKKHQAQLTKLLRSSGADFDRAYAKSMVSDHKKDVAEFEKQSTKGGDSDVKAFASSNLPTLQQHLQMAMALEGSGSTERNVNSNSNSNSNKNKNSNKNSNDNSNRP